MALHGSILNVKHSENMSLSVEFGPDFWIHNGENQSKNEFLAHYSIGIAFIPMSNLSVRSEWLGLGIGSSRFDGAYRLVALPRLDRLP